MENTLENEMLDAAISWCDSNGINVLEPEQLSRLVNSLCITVRDAALDTAQQAQPERAPLSDDAYEALVDDLGEWARHVVEDTAHITLDTHIRRTLTVHGIKQGGQHD